PRPVLRRDGPGGARAVFAVLCVPRPDDADRGAGGEARRPAAHAPGGRPGRGRLLPGTLRAAAGGAVRGGGLAHLAGLGGALHLPERRRGRPARRGRGGRGALSLVEHAAGWRRVRAGTRVPRG